MEEEEKRQNEMKEKEEKEEEERRIKEATKKKREDDTKPSSSSTLLSLASLENYDDDQTDLISSLSIRRTEQWRAYKKPWWRLLIDYIT